MKRLLIAVLLCLLVSGFASADTVREYTLQPAEINVEALLTITFEDQAKNAQTDDREYLFYELPGYDGRPFCGLDDTVGFGQLRLSGYPYLPDSEHPSVFTDNVEPSGVAKCSLTSEEALQKSEAWLKALGITDAYLQSVTAYGKLEKYTGVYLLAFGQQLNGLPVYWAAATQRDEWTKPQSNRIEIIIGDSGLISLYGYWSEFEPVSRETEITSEVDAGARFSAMGLEMGYDELCYLLTGTRDAAMATLAYRYQNRFISAADGSVLQ